MLTLSLRTSLYFNAHRVLVGSLLGREYTQISREDQAGNSTEKTNGLLAGLLNHSMKNVPFYRQSIIKTSDKGNQEPGLLLAPFPILTKELIRLNFEQLKSDDLSLRKWTYNSSGGSTGEPLRLVQDRYFTDRQMALQWLSFNWAGRYLGQPAVHLWGSEKDILQQTIGMDKKILRHVTNDQYLNAFLMTPEKMRTYLQRINSFPPRLIVAYAQSIYELARFANREKIAVTPQSAVMTSAGTLYPFMRQEIESVFQCRVFNRYGSREVGDIACECPAHEGLHIFPWGNYMEIVDELGNPVPDGREGNILVTNLYNYAMPLIRYSIGDRGVLSPAGRCSCGRRGQILERLSGRNVDVFRKKDGSLVDGEYFTHLLYFKDWVEKFQVVQKDYDRVVYKIQKTVGDYLPNELDEITEKTKVVMGEGCTVDYEFCDQILPSSSGKLRYTISEVKGGS